MLKHLLIVFHSQSGKTLALAQAIEEGAKRPSTDGVETRLIRCTQAWPKDMIWANAIVFATPENFGYMSGAMKDFFDRTFYPCAGRLEGKAFAVVVGAGNDGTGAVNSVRRIVKGLSLREVQEPIVINKPLSDEALEACRTLGETMAAGLEVGIF